jgi:cellulose synthase/poly-beta-1,6-N-acetylglucosamine synthase-like glycosyltransferase
VFRVALTILASEWGPVVILELLLLIADASLLLAATVVGVLVLVLLIEILLSLAKPRAVLAEPAPATCCYTIVMPAHDEVGTIEHTLAVTLAQVSDHGSVLVVADNCTDETAAVSAAAGAKVIKRTNPAQRGKGYALDFAMRSLASHPPDVVVILDADCTPTPGTIERLVSSCHRLGRPVQARYELTTPERGAGLMQRVGAFAWRVKNIVRPTGLANVGLPCLLMGTGMAFPYAALARTHLDTGHLVEDMVLGLELTDVGQAPVFLPEACVTSALPPSVEGQASQRTRWETGHLQVISELVPRYLWRGVRTGNVRLCALALHAAVPPLAFLALMLIGIVLACVLVAAAGGQGSGFDIALAACAGAALALGIAWHRCGRDLLSATELLMLPFYVISKLSMYARALTGQKLQWVRTKRD